MLFSTALSVAAVLGMAPAALAHSWIEQIRVIDSSGSFVGDVTTPGSLAEGAGYIRNNLFRTNMASNEDIIYRIQDLDPKKPLCRKEQSKVGAVKDGPKLKASPGDMVALRYTENGHTTKLEPGRPDKGGIVYIYGTTEPKDDELLKDIFKVWTADGKGGDGRGRLLATRNYDDGKCFESGGTDREINKLRFDAAMKTGKLSAENTQMGKELGLGLWCQNDFVIPADWKAEGSVAIYWVWDWQMTTPGAPVEMYTSCMDIDLVAGPGTSKNVKFAQTDPNLAAIESQLTNQFDVAIPEMGATPGQSPKLPGPLPDQEKGKERVPNDGASPGPDASAPAPEQPKPEPKPTPSAQPSPPAPVKSEAPKASDAKPPGQGDFVPGMGPGPTATATVTVSIPGPTSFKTVYVGVQVGQTLTAGEEPAAPATSGAASSSGSASATSASAQASPKASAGAGGNRPNVEPFMNAASIVAPTPSPSAPSSISIPSSSLVADSTTASPPAPATTPAPSTTTPSPAEEVQVVTEEATITTYETIVTSFVKPSSTSSVIASPLPTLDATQPQGTGVVSARSVHFKAHKAKELPRFRRLKRAL